MSKRAPPLIIFVPGKNPKPAADAHREQLYRCVKVGLERAGSKTAGLLAENPQWFELLSWNELFYQRSVDIEAELPWINRMLQTSAPTARDKRDASTWKVRLAWMIYSVADRLPSLIPLIANPTIRSTIEETLVYFRNTDEIGARVRQLLQDRLRRAFDEQRPVMIIGHSMGSVIAYDALWEMCHELDEGRKVSQLLTIGSPLGLNFVQKRLLGADRPGADRYPCNIESWVNVSAIGELTALDREFADDFHAMVDLGLLQNIKDHHRGVYNYYRDNAGLNVHRSYGYLVNPIPGEIIGNWLARALDEN